MTANQLLAAACRRQSVIGFHWHRDIPMPAAFLQNMPFRMVAMALPRLQVYKPKKKLNHPYQNERTSTCKN